MKKLLIYGSKVFAGVIKDLALACNYEVAGLIDDYATGGEILGDYEYVRKHFLPGSYEIVIAVGYNDFNARWAVYTTVLEDGYNLPTLIHPKAYVRDVSSIGVGSVVMAGVIVDFNTTIGRLCVLWPGVIVNHDSRIGDNTFLSPNATVCGCVEVMGKSFIGAGSVIADHVVVPEGTFIKAGSIFTDKKNQELHKA